MQTRLPLSHRIVLGILCAALAPAFAGADGIVVPPRDYNGSLEEGSQEAIIIFHGSAEPGQATEDMILKIQVIGDATNFAWVVPFPSEPTIEKEDAKLFSEVFAYVEAKKYASQKKYKAEGAKVGAANDAELQDSVQVLSRKTVGDFDIAVVRENADGGLNPWLTQNGYQELDNAEETLAFYRDKQYVFACIKVNSEVLESERSVESHPLRFTFTTGGRDGIYFPMKMTGLQSEPFDVNLYVFYRAWLNDKLSPFGYQHRGFSRRYRDWDSPKCVPNGGKSYSLPAEDPFLSGFEQLLPTVTKLFQKLHPGAKYYLTNVQANGLVPSDVRQWKDDLWLFPYYTDRNMIPYDARPGGPAHAAYGDVALIDRPQRNRTAAGESQSSLRIKTVMAVSVIGIALLAIVAVRRLTIH